MASVNFEPWGGVTDPDQHNPEQYRYLVHADTGTPRSRKAKRREYFLPNLSSIFTYPYLSASLIDQDHRSMHGGAKHGLIFAVPRSGIITAFPSDLFLEFRDIEDVKRRHPTIPDPDEIMEQTLRNNEIICSTEHMAVVGVAFYGQEYRRTRYAASTIARMGGELGLPAVAIEPPAGIKPIPFLPMPPNVSFGHEVARKNSP